MKKIKTPKAKNVQPVVLTQDTLISFVREIEWMKNKIETLEKKQEGIMDVAAGAYPERKEGGLLFRCYNEEGDEESVFIKI